MSQSFLALLHGINVGGHRKVPMADLRALAEGLGYQRVRTYIASGNLLFEADTSAAHLEAALEAAIAARFGFAVIVTVRTAEQWRAHAAGSPFPDAEAARPNLLMLGAAKGPVAGDAAATLRPYLGEGERVAVIADGLWIDFANGSVRSKLTPKVLERALGGPVTTRNWRSVQTLAGLLDAPEA